MNILALDTSSDFASIALSFRKELYFEEQGNIRQHAQFLLPMIEALLKKSGATIGQLDGIAFGRGPGSFTGLRIACAVAKGLSLAHDLPLYPVSSLKAIAHEVYAQEQMDKPFSVLAMIDARMEQLYWAHYRKSTEDANEHVSNPQDIVLSDEKDPAEPSLIIAGVGIEPYLSQLPESTHAQIIKTCTIFPHARAIVKLVQEGCCKASTALDALPQYVRNDVAQVSTKLNQNIKD